MQENFHMAWQKVKYTKNQIKKAGCIIIDENISQEIKEINMNIVNNWKAAHAYPMSVIFNTLKRVLVNDENTLIVSRLKRLDSIEGKLRRNPTMSIIR